MKTTIECIVVALILLLPCCKKKEINVSPKNYGCRLISISNQKNGNVHEYFYSSDGKPIRQEVKLIANSDPVRTYMYTWENDNLVRIQSGIYRWELQYSDSGIIEKYYDDGVLKGLTRKTIHFVGSDTSIHYSYVTGAMGRQIFLYEDDNLTEIHYGVDKDSSGTFTPSAVTYLEYDKNPNAFLSVAETENGILHLRKSKNNITKWTTVNTSGTTSVYNYSYLYNESGLPTDEFADGSELRNYTYSCSQ